MSFAEANASSARHQQHADMRLVAGGTFRMGSDRHYPEEASVHRVTTFKEYPPSQVCGTLTVDEAVAMISHGAGSGK